MQLSDISVLPVLSESFQELAYIVRKNDSSNCFVIDPGLEPEGILNTIKQAGLTPVALLITHGHGDHIGGIPAMIRHWNCQIYVGELDADKLTDPITNLSATFGFDLMVPPADVLLRDDTQLDIAGIRIEVRHVPGHSKGHIIFYIPAKPHGIAFVGDTVFQGSIGRSDFPDGEPRIQIPMIRSKILSLPENTVLYPGHGGSTTVAAEKKSNPFLQ